MVKHEEKRVMIFVDGSNLFWGCDRFGKRNRIPHFRIDPFKLIPFLTDNRDFIRAHWYVSTTTPPLIKQSNFYDYLEKNGIVVTKKPLVKGKEKGVDVALVTDLLCSGFNRCYDVGIIFSGDRDLCSAYDEIRRLGLTIEVVAFQGDYNSIILKHCDRFIDIDKYASNLKN